jgi:pre-mRNA-splicing factor SYF2
VYFFPIYMPPFPWSDADAASPLFSLRLENISANLREINCRVDLCIQISEELAQRGELEEKITAQKAERVTMSSDTKRNAANKRRKLSPEPSESIAETTSAAKPTSPKDRAEPQRSENQTDSAAQPTSTAPPTAPSSHSDRVARFAALKTRATQSQRENLSAAKTEAQRTALDPSVLNNLNRKAAIASHNLLKADTEESSGTGAFERKRAWDYTIEESEKWDERMAQKKGRKEGNAFQDWGAEAGKVYERQVRDMEKIAATSSGVKGEGVGSGAGGKTLKGGRLREEYEDGKRGQIEAAAANGDLEIVELSTGELVAIDKDGTFYTNNNQENGFIQSTPRKENIDRLVSDLQKADEQRMAKRKKRLGEQADSKEGDVTFINEKNKQFNLKLGRFYDRYTTEIRESFERGSAL